MYLHNDTEAMRIRAVIFGKHDAAEIIGKFLRIFGNPDNHA